MVLYLKSFLRLTLATTGIAEGMVLAANDGTETKLGKETMFTAGKKRFVSYYVHRIKEPEIKSIPTCFWTSKTNELKIFTGSCNGSVRNSRGHGDQKGQEHRNRSQHG